MEAAITGMGAVSSLGRGTPALWAGVAEGRDGISAIARFSTDRIKVKIAGSVPDRNHASAGEKPSRELTAEFALDAGREALRMAGLAESGIPPERVALVFGTSLGDGGAALYLLTERIAAEFGIRGPALTVSTACSSSTNAMGLGLDLLRQGGVDAVLAGGSDALTPIMLSGFHALGVLSTEKCAPFSHPFGTTLGEGAGFLVLERRTDAARRGAEIHGMLAGYGLSADAFHETSPDPTGSGVARAIAGALAHAGVPADEIGYINAHGTGTLANDAAETRALRGVFGPAADAMPVSSTKSILGHAQGAAGVLETIVTLMSMRRQVVPPTLHFTSPRRDGPADPVAASGPRAHRYRYAVCTNSAFGGANAAVVLAAPGAGAPEAGPPPAAPGRRVVFITGAAAIGAHGMDAEALTAAMAAGLRINAGRVPDFPLADAVPGIDPRGLDPSTRFLTAAAATALAGAGIGVKRTRRDRVGLVMGINLVSAESDRALQKSIEENGLHLLSATAFSRMVLNAPVGTCSKLLALGGPSSTVSIGHGSGLAAVIYAAEMMGYRADADAIAAGGLDEMDGRPGHPFPGEGAACVVLAPAPKAGETAISVAGWAMAGPGRLEEAVAAALASAGLPASEVAAVFGSGLGNILPGLPRFEPEHALGYGEAFTAAAALVAAVARLRRGGPETLLVASGAGGSATCALILTGRSEHG